MASIFPAFSAPQNPPAVLAADTTLDVDGGFVAIGHHPATELFRGHIALDDDGYLSQNLEDLLPLLKH